MKKKVVMLGVLITAIAFSCKQSGNKETRPIAAATTQTEDSTIIIANQFFQQLPAVAENKENVITPTKVKLGKLLFYDTRLSQRGNISCNSCHNLAKNGVDNQATSLGNAGQRGGRNSPTVFNAGTSQYAVLGWPG